MRTLSFTAAAALMLAAAAWIHGERTGRWGTSADVAAAAARLDEVPARFGDWHSEPLSINPKELEVAEVSGHLSRVYTHRFSGERISVLLVAGQPGPISLHPPDVCYQGAGYRPGPANVREVSGGEFRVADFAKPSAVENRMRIYWAWSDDGETWSAPESPRMAYLRSDILYKLYVISRPPARVEQDDRDDSLEEFLPLLLKELADTLP